MRAAIYARVSTERQERQQTIASQLTALRDWARAQTDALAEVHVFRDEGYSGSRLDRPGLDGLRDAVRDAAIDVVAVFSPDRLARNISVPIGYVWHRDLGLGFDPDLRIQEAIRQIFQRFRQLGSARSVHLAMAADQVHFPRPSDGQKLVTFDWAPIRYRNVISVLKNPFYAGAYAYGKSEKRIEIVDGRARKSYGHGRPLEDWEVLLKDHHEGYIDWGEFNRNQAQLASNAYGLVGGPKSGRGGSALLSGLITCGRCGRRLAVAYTGRCSRRPVYRCDRPNQMLGRPRCLGFGGSRIEAAIAREVLLVVEPMAVEAALEAERRRMESRDERQSIADLELQQARYEAALAERRYAACDPDNRLITAQLEKSWEASLQRVKACEARLEGLAP